VRKALGIKKKKELSRVESNPGTTILLDTWEPVARVGIGGPLDWSIAGAAVDRWPGRRIILAGGLTPIDVASRAGSGTPGRKDLAKVRDCIATIRKDAVPA